MPMLGEEVVGEVAHRAPADLVLDADDRLGDAVPLVLEEEHLDRVAHLVGLPLRHVLEHVAGGELELARPWSPSSCEPLRMNS